MNHYRKFVSLLADLSDLLTAIYSRNVYLGYGCQIARKVLQNLKTTDITSTSCTLLSKADNLCLWCQVWNYSQIKSEAHSLIIRVKKFHNFLYGCTFLAILVTGHQLIFGLKKGIVTRHGVECRDWLLFLLAMYTHGIQCKPTANMEMLPLCQDSWNNWD